MLGCAYQAVCVCDACRCPEVPQLPEALGSKQISSDQPSAPAHNSQDALAGHMAKEQEQMKGVWQVYSTGSRAAVSFIHSLCWGCSVGELPAQHTDLGGYDNNI